MESNDTEHVTPIRRPGFGVAVDRRKVRALREAAYLERLDVSELSKTVHLRQIAAGHDIPGYETMTADELRAVFEARGIALPRHTGISRDCVAKIENGDRAHPKITTVGILIDTLNTGLARRGLPAVSIEAVYADGQAGSA